MTSRTTPLMPTETARTRPWWQLGLAAGLGAAVINVVIFALYQLVTGTPLRVVPPAGGPSQELAVAMVVIASLVPPVLATLLAIALSRWTRPASIWFTVITLIAVVLSLLSPLSLPAEISMGNKLTLAAMHLVTAVTTLAVFVPRLSAARD
jgi:hypothetical protein